MKTLLRTIVPLLLLLPVLAPAQHDPQRNATRRIANDNFEKAEEDLAKADDREAETHFVRMMLALKKGETETAVGHAREALDRGLPFARLMAGPRELLAPLAETGAFKRWSAERGGADLELIHGPMVGRVTDTTASFWVRTARPATVRIKIGDRLSETSKTSAARDFIGIAVVEGLEAATTYRYDVLVDGEPVPVENAEFTTFPKEGGPGKFSVAFGGGAGYVPKWETMWDTIGSFKPAALLMLGDNVYIDQPEHSLCQHYCYYRRQSRPEWRRLTASTAVYSIYDDHDFGTNDCVPGPEVETPTWKREVWNIFRQNWLNPGYGGGEQQPGCWYDFHIGDVHFMMLDGRYYRDRKGGTMLGPAQKRWLLENLEKSKGTFKVLASPVPWTEGIKPGSKDPWDGFPEEREEIFSFIEKNEIPGVFLVAADRHRTDLRTTDRPDGYTLYEFESSRLTNRHTHGVVNTPGLIWGYNETCSFGLMKFDTTAEDPVVTFECITIDGEVKHSFDLKASALK